MAEPWENFKPETAPVATPTAPAAQPAAAWENFGAPDEGPGIVTRVANAANKGLGEFLELPDKLINATIVPAINAASNAVGGGDIAVPHLASDDLKRMGALSDNPNMAPQSKGEEYAQSVARAAGGNAIPAILSGGLSAPIAAVEAGASAGQGIGGQMAKDAFPNSPVAQSLGELAGGLSVGALTHLATAMFQGGRTAKEIIDATGGRLNEDEVKAAVQHRDSSGDLRVDVRQNEPLANLLEGTNPEQPTIPPNDFNPAEAPQITPEQAAQHVNAGPEAQLPLNDFDPSQGPQINQAEANKLVEAGLPEDVTTQSLPDNPQGRINHGLVPDEALKDGPYANTKMEANVNSERLGTDDETRQYLGEAMQDAEVHSQTHGELIDKTDKLLKDKSPLDILAADPRASEIEAHQLATRAILKGSLDKMSKAADAVLDPKTDSSAAADELEKWRYMTGLASAKASGNAALAGRLLNSYRVMAGDASTGMAKAFEGTDAIDSKQFAELVQKYRDPAIRRKLAEQSFEPGWKDIAANVANIPRSIMSSFDLSAPFNQGLGMVHKKEFWQALPSMVKQFGSEATHDAAQAAIKADPNYALMKRSKLYLAGEALSKREEQFMSSYAEKIPVLGHGIRASERAYVGFLNKVRADVFNDLVKKANAAGIDFKKDPKALNDISKFINTSTGRGDLGPLNNAAPALNAVFFSPRLIASRVQMLNPAYYVKLEPFARKEALKSLLAVGAFGATALGLAKAGGLGVGIDPRSTDFAKIKVGNTRISPLGSFQPYLRLGSQLVTGQRVTSAGKVQNLGEKFGTPTRLDMTLNFLESKESPVLSFITDWMRGKNAAGKPFDLNPTNPDGAIASRFVPMFIQDMNDVYQDGGIGRLLAVAAPAALGVGTQTYSPTDPTATRLGVTNPDDAVVQELHRIEGGGNAIITPVGSKIDVNGDSVKLSKEQKDAYQKDAGQQIYHQLADRMKQPDWSKMSVEDQRDTIKDIMTDAKEDARDRIAIAPTWNNFK